MLNLSEKHWRDIEGYEGIYQIHREGYVRNASGLVMKTYVINSGYQALKLRDPSTGRSKAFLVHRLVAAAFVRNRNPAVLVMVNHKDGNKLNCRWTNLQWCTNSMNILHARRTGLNPYNKPTVGKKFGTSSKYRGVTYLKEKNRWRAYVRNDNVYIEVRTFATEVEAAKHYNSIVRRYKLNRPLNIITESKSLTTRESTPRRKRVS